MSVSCREACRCPGVVEKLSRMFRSDQEALPNIREWLGDPPVCPGVVGSTPVCPGMVGRPSQMSGKGQETLPDIQGWSGDPTGCL